MRHVSIAIILIATFLLAAFKCGSNTRSQEPLSELVNVFIGTTSGGNTSPAAHAPFGMISFGPTNYFSPDEPNPYISRAGYDYSKDSIASFSLTHVSGWGCHGALDIPFMAVSGEVSENPVYNPSACASGFSHDNELAGPGYYDVLLSDFNTQVKGSVSERSAIIEYVFPSDRQPHIVFAPTNCSNGITDATIIIDTTRNEVSGYATSGGFCSRNPSLYDYTVYFAAAFDSPFISFGGWHGKREDIVHSNRFSGDSIAGFVSFRESAVQVLEMRVAISFVSIENARMNLITELSDKTLVQLRDETTSKWNKGLSKMRVADADKDMRTQLYTALYHNMLHPNIFEDINGEYRGFNDSVYVMEEGRHKYVNFSTWDTYRTTAQLQGLLFPAEASDMIRSLYLDVQQGAPQGLPIWGYFNNETGVMNGHGSVPLIANMYAFGARNIDLPEIKEALVWNADHKYRSGDIYIQYGYVPDYESPWNYCVSKTLEYATADYGVAQMCKYAGDSMNFHRFEKRSGNVFHLFNEASGYLQRKNMEGEWIMPFDSASEIGFNEGNSAQYTWNIPHKLPELIEKMGGEEQTIQRLDRFTSKILRDGWNVEEPYYWPANQPSFIAPYVYNYTGVPEKAQELISETITNLFENSPSGLPGNDDLGATSAMFLFQIAGIYPIIPGVPEVTLSGSLVEEVSLHLDNGAVITLKSTNRRNENGTISSIQVNGKTHDSYFVDLSKSINGQEDLLIEFNR